MDDLESLLMVVLVSLVFATVAYVYFKMKGGSEPVAEEVEVPRPKRVGARAKLSDAYYRPKEIGVRTGKKRLFMTVKNGRRSLREYEVNEKGHPLPDRQMTTNTPILA